MLERDIEKHGNTFAERLGCWQKKFKTPGRRAAPDRIYALNGRVWWIEYKAPGETPTKLQVLEHERMRKHGLRVYVCDSKESARAVIQKEVDAASL